MESLVSPVTLIVKSCNQQFEDQEIRCEMNWTIRKLKQQLAEVYPTKPRTEEQKLIYSGQLLHDTVVLKDVLRKYEGQDTHTVHLVFTPKNNGTIMKESENKTKSSNNNTSSQQQSSGTSSNGGNTDGLRQRTTTTTGNANQRITQPVFNAANMLYSQAVPAATASTTTTQNPNSPDYLAAQQAAMQAWMQQAYAQYFNQYMMHMSAASAGAAQIGQAAPFYANLYAQQPHTPQMIPNFNPNQNPVVAQASTSAAVANNNNPEVAQVQPQPPQQQQPERRFPNLVVEEQQEHRDWLDISYTMFRLIVIITLIFFYSSPLRCLVVFSIGLTLYFYRNGFFRNQIERNLNLNNNNNNNNNNNQNNNNNNNRQPQERRENNNNNGELINQTGADQVDVADTTGQDQNRTSTLVMIRTFIFSFIFSLIPETPAL